MASIKKPSATNAYTATTTATPIPTQNQNNIHIAASPPTGLDTPHHNPTTNPAISSISFDRLLLSICVTPTANSDAINGSAYIMLMTLQYHHPESSSMDKEQRTTTITAPPPTSMVPYDRQANNNNLHIMESVYDSHKWDGRW